MDGEVLVVEGSRISARLPPDAAVGFEVVDLPGVTVLPGLIDTHVHLIGDGSVGALLKVRTPAEREAVIRASLARHLAAGVTTVRDLGDSDWSVASRPGSADEPTVVRTGPPLTTPGGHCAAMGGVAAGPSELRAAVAERAARGVDLVKIMVSGGAMTPGSDLLALQYSLADVALVVAEAHAAGLPVVAHAHSVAAAEICVAAGVDDIEHITCLTESGVRTPPALLESLVESGVFVGPTLGRVPGSAPSAQSTAVTRRTGLTVADRLEHTLMLYEAGVRIISGSDGGIHPGKPHGILPFAIAELVEAGIPAAYALASATSLAASACGLGHRKGSLRPGFDADLLFVEGDPLTDITALRRVHSVVRREPS